jgi:hypothetical protein
VLENDLWQLNKGFFFVHMKFCDLCRGF